MKERHLSTHRKAFTLYKFRKLYREYQFIFDRIKENVDEFFIKNLVNETKVPI